MRGVSGRSPFLAVAAPCRVCAGPFRGRRVRAKTYEVVEEDADRFPKVVRWLDPSLQAIRPHHYHFAACLSCGYVDAASPSAGGSGSWGDPAAALRALTAPAPPTVPLLRGVPEIDASRWSLRSVLAIHLLGIATHERLAPARRDPSRLGPLSLRTAWLYRESPGEIATPGVRLFLGQVQAVWPDAPASEAAALRRAATYYATWCSSPPPAAGASAAGPRAERLMLLAEIRRRSGDPSGAVAAAGAALRLAASPAAGGSPPPWAARIVRGIESLQGRLSSGGSA